MDRGGVRSRFLLSLLRITLQVPPRYVLGGEGQPSAGIDMHSVGSINPEAGKERSNATVR